VAVARIGVAAAPEEIRKMITTACTIEGLRARPILMAFSICGAVVNAVARPLPGWKDYTYIGSSRSCL